MKILRRGNEFRKVSENNMKEINTVKSLINQGWNYCPKQDYKIFVRGEIKKVEEITPVENDVKVKTTAKERRSDDKKKLVRK